MTRSVNRMSQLSRCPRKYPATAPTRMPTMVDTRPTMTMTMRDVWVPRMTRANTSGPAGMRQRARRVGREPPPPRPRADADRRECQQDDEREREHGHDRGAVPDEARADDLPLRQAFDLLELDRALEAFGDVGQAARGVAVCGGVRWRAHAFTRIRGSRAA